MKKHLSLALTAFFMTSAAWAQTEVGNFSATGRGGVVNTFTKDYQSIGVNPANLGRGNTHVFSFSLAEFGFAAGTGALSRDVFNKFMNTDETRLDSASKRDLANMFNSNKVATFNAQVNTFAASVYVPKVGGFAFSNSYKVNARLGFNKNAADIMFLGKNAPIYTNAQNGELPLISEAFDGTSVQIYGVDEWNLAYGRSLVDLPALKLSAGVGLKYLRGLAVMDVRAENGALTAYTAESPSFGITNYEDFRADPNFNEVVKDRGLQPVGTGFGADLGITAQVQDKYIFSLAVTDIGSMNWNGNLITANDTILSTVNSEGAKTYNLLNAFEDFSDANGLVYGAARQRRESLATRLRMGAGMVVNEKLEVGLDINAPLNNAPGNIGSMFIGVGADYKPVKFLRLSSGLNHGGGFGFGLPVGVSITTSAYEFGVATRDVLGFTVSDNPNASFAMGFLRFKIGKLDKK